jgi:hypothetical protein
MQRKSNGDIDPHQDSRSLFMTNSSVELYLADLLDESFEGKIVKNPALASAPNHLTKIIPLALRASRSYSFALF